jgi:hypothetical protein
MREMINSKIKFENFQGRGSVINERKTLKRILNKWV